MALVFSTHLLDDMVSDWLKMQDNVMVETGEPTWISLVEALERIEQQEVTTSIKGIANTTILSSCE